MSAPPTRPATVEGAGRSHRRRVRRPRGQRAGVIVLVVVVLLAPVGVSVGRAMSAPGQASGSVRLVEWLRDHGAGGLVDAAENWWYSRPRFGTTAPDPGSLTTGRMAPAPDVPVGVPHPGALPVPADRLPGEAVWTPSVARAGGRAPLYTTWFRPLRNSPDVVAGVAWMDQTVIRTQLIAGTVDPPTSSGRPADGAEAQVPVGRRRDLVATFASGFKLRDARGGYFANGREVVALERGAASLAVDAAGRVSVGRWGFDLTPGPGIVAVRQNLDLVVENGSPVPGLDANAGGAWGTPRNQFQYTWRSGLGTDAAGDLVYVAADGITLSDLAGTLAAAGAVRGMQLDIHPQTVTFLSYRPDQASVFGEGTPLLPAMRPPPDRYLVPSQRDFLAVTVGGG